MLLPIQIAIHKLGPAYLSDLWCNVGVFLQDFSAKFKHTLGDRSFTAAAPYGTSYRTILE